jgi:hypothetical protein
MPIDYQVLGLLIDKERPYGEDAQTDLGVDLTDAKVYDPRTPRGFANPSDRDRIDVFGPLEKFGQGNHLKVEVDPAEKNPARQVFAADPHVREAIETSGIPLDFGNGSPYTITKGLRIPYQYTSNGQTIYANIFILFNGSGHV